MAARRQVVLSKQNADGTIDRKLYNPVNLQHNMRVATNIRILMSIVGGLCAGILGLTGLSGAGFYLVFMAIASAALAAKAHFRPAQVTHSAKALYLDGLTAGGVSYVLFWTLAFNCTHMYGSA